MMKKKKKIYKKRLKKKGIKFEKRPWFKIFWVIIQIKI